MNKKMIQILSYSKLKSSIANKEKTYLLIYKKGSEKSDCAFENISIAAKNEKSINIFFVDVNITRDIHTQFNISTAPVLLKFENGIFKNLIKGCNNANYYKTVFNGTVFPTNGNSTSTPQKRVTVYSTPTCSWCTTLKNYLKDHKINFNDIDISANQKAADELVKRSGQTGVPQTDINGEIIVGFNQKRINELLNIKN